MYINARNNAAITALEFSPTKDGTLTYIHLNSSADADRVRELLVTHGQTIVAQPQSEKETIIIACGNSPESELLKLLSGPGDTFAIPSEKKKLNPWAWRGGLSVAGQSLQIASGAFALNKEDIAAGKTKPDKFDLALIWFAIPNLIANIINYTFGAQKSQDVYGLRKIKDSVNEEVNKYLPDNAQFNPAPDTVHKTAYEDKKAPKLSPFTTFLKKYSVVFGEVGLRVFGSFNMAFSPANWKKAFPELFKGNFVNAYELGKTADKMTHISGVGMLLGKFISFFPKTPDPNDPKPKSWLDNIREKYLFKASSAVEFSATSVLLYDRLKNKKLVINGKEHTDYYGLAGNSLFDTGYIVRWFAPFGKKELDMNEVNGYVLDALKAVPQEKRAEAMAGITLKLKEQLRDSLPSYGKVYSQIAQDFDKYNPVQKPHDPESETQTTQHTGKIKPRTSCSPAKQSQNMQDRVLNSRSGAIIPAL